MSEFQAPVPPEWPTQFLTDTQRQAKFMDACGQKRKKLLLQPPDQQDIMYKGLIDEEYAELVAAWDKFTRHPSLENLVEVVDACGDIKVVVNGLMNSMGVPFDDAYSDIMRTNEVKVDPQTGLVRRREDGKILKPEGWIPPTQLLWDLLHQEIASNSTDSEITGFQRGVSP